MGNYIDTSNVSHGFILEGKNYTTLDFAGGDGVNFTGLNPSGEISGFSCSDPACGNTRP